MFTFDTDSLVSFELGRYDHQCEGGLTSHGSATAAQAPASDPADATLDGRNLPAEMTKVSRISHSHLRLRLRPCRD